MQLTFLGSAAAEAWPALFCTCEACAKARQLGGKNVRRRTSYRLGDHIQIDWGPDTTAACLAYGLDMSALTHLVVTHAHEDHFAPYEMYYRRPGFSLVPQNALLNVFGPPGVQDALKTVAKDEDTFRVRSHVPEPYREYPLNDQVTLIPIEASHGRDIGGAYNYIFRVGDQHFLLGHDTGWWESPVWGFLSQFEFNLVIMDCTYVRLAQRAHHLGCQDVVDVKAELQRLGGLAADCRFLANHFSHNGQWLHEQMQEFFAPYDIQVGYDGLKIVI